MSTTKPPTAPKTFVLVHGSWQGAWSWDEVRQRLRARGHRVVAPALPGRGPVDDDRSRIGHEDNVSAVLAALDAASADRVVLVGHSLGGVTISQVADRRPGQVERLVYCAGFVLEDGQAAADVLPEAVRAQFLSLAATRPDRAIPMPWELWRSAFLQAADEPLARSSFERLSPEPYRPVFEPIRLARPVHRSLPAAFVAFRQDRTMPPGFWHPGMTARLDGADVVEVDGDHETALSAPGRLAEALHQIVAAGQAPGRGAA